MNLLPLATQRTNRSLERLVLESADRSSQRHQTGIRAENCCGMLFEMTAIFPACIDCPRTRISRAEIRLGLVLLEKFFRVYPALHRLTD
jgi:hypothetical protein